MILEDLTFTKNEENEEEPKFGKLNLPTIPNLWIWGRLEDAAVNEKNAIVDGPFGSNLKVSDYIEGENGVPVLTTKNLELGYKRELLRYISYQKFEQLKRSEVKGGDIIVAKIGSCGKTGIYPKKLNSAMIPANLLKMTVRTDIDKLYVYYFLNSEIFKEELNTIISATAQPAFNVSKFRKLFIPLAPLSEQNRIVEEIEKQFTRLDAGVASLKAAQARLKRYKAAVLKAACEGQLVPQDLSDEPASHLLRRILAERRARWEADQRARGKDPSKLKYEEPASPDTTDLPELPEGWVWSTFDMLGEVQGGIQKQPKRTPGNNSFPYLRVANVFRNRLDLTEVYKLEVFGDELERLRLKTGDLLIVEGNGSQTEIGRSAIWKGEIENCIHQNHIIRVRFLKISSIYVNHYLNSPLGIGKMMAVASSTSGLFTLSVSKVKSISLPLPPLAEQARIVAEVESRLSVVQALEATLQANLKRAERLRQSILQRAFSGQLVPQDPSDEPASILLDRIRAEREKQAKQTARSAKPGNKQMKMEGI